MSIRQVLNKTFWLVFLCTVLFGPRCFAIGQERYIVSNSDGGNFCIAQNENVTDIYVDLNDYPGVIRAASDLKADIYRVTRQTAKMFGADAGLGKNVIIIGTVGKSGIIDKLIDDGKIDVNQIKGKWESFIIQVVPVALPGVENALVIAGSDKRGTTYGIYDLSEQIGVSPWYWWADVPVQHKDALFVKAGRYVQGPPAVQYRGIFLNDEAPCLTGWVKEKFGDYNSKFYTKVFELLLRLKANYLWPAMWNNAFNEDDPNNPKLADEYGIVMGTSHQEPMLRAQKEWDRRYKKNWNYYADANTLRDFWREGIRRNRNYESIITIGLRGADDTPMIPDGNVPRSMALLEEIVAVQRKMIAEEINPDVTKVPQLWCLYKEVQEYYEKGLRVPDDVTLLWSDDNWGNLRRLPTGEERKRAGGAGIYYHFDYHGGPRSYEWINSTPITKIWEQMNLAYNYGATKIWIVNVGDLKPMEIPIEFFMSLAWDPQRWPKEKLSEYMKLWAQREFGPKYAEDIADIVSKYTKYHARRKAELLEPSTYSIINYNEADRISAEFNEITAKAEKIYNDLPENAKDAFYQLVLYPTKGLATVTDLYIAAAKNKLYAKQRRASTNDMAAKVRDLFKQDAEMSDYYNKKMADGKWNHMMDAKHIGWTAWNPPAKNIMPKVEEINIPDEADMRIAIEGSEETWPGSSTEPILPELSVFSEQKKYIEVFARGLGDHEFVISTSAPWIVISPDKKVAYQLDEDISFYVNINWDKAAKGDANGFAKIVGPGAEETKIKITTFNPAEPNKAALEGFVEADGYVSMEAAHYTKKIDAGSVRWEEIPDYGRTDSAMSIFPVTAKSVTPPENSPCLEYKMYIFHPGNLDVELIVAPTLNFVPGRGLRIALSFDNQQPGIIEILPANFDARNGNSNWEQSVRDSVLKVKSTHTVAEAGYHTLKVWMVDPGVVLQKIVVNTGGVKPSYLGPPESSRGTSSKKQSKADEDNPDGNGAFATGKYRNLFAEAGYSQEEIKKKVNDAFQQLFHGDPCTQAIYFPAGKNANGPLAYIKDVASNDVRSEGMSYGMMIAVQLGKKSEFDALWNWARTYMYISSPNHPAYGFFSWSLKTDGTPNAESPAPDGEEYFVMSLYFAANRWGNGDGLYNYKAEADRILSDIKNRGMITGETIRGPMTAGALFDLEHKMVRFTPDVVNIDHTDPSYHLPAFYELWARWGPEADRIFWTQAASASREFFQKAAHPVTGLAPEYANFDGTPWASPRNRNSANFAFDSWRTSMNWSVDWAWWGKDIRERQLSDRLQAFFEMKGITTYGNQFALDGSNLSGNQFGSDHSAGLVAMNAVNGLAATHSRAKEFVEDFWNQPIPSGHYRYYDGMLYMMAMLHCSEEFKIWSPQP